MRNPLIVPVIGTSVMISFQQISIISLQLVGFCGKLSIVAFRCRLAYKQYVKTKICNHDIMKFLFGTLFGLIFSP